MNRLELSNLEFSHTLMHPVENPREGGQVAQIFEKNPWGLGMLFGQNLNGGFIAFLLTNFSKMCRG